MRSFVNLRKSRLVRYMVVGGLSYILEITFLLLLARGFALNDTLSVAIAFWVGLLASFSLQKTIAFSSKTTKRQTSRQFAYYMILVGINYAFTIGFVHLLAPLIGLIMARTAALIITTVWNFVIYKKLIFKA